MPGEEEYYSIQGTNLYGYTLAKCRVYPVDISYLKEILQRDESKRQKLLQVLAFRFLSIFYEQVPKLNLLSEPNLRYLCSMSRFKYYQKGENIDMIDGGVIFAHSISLKNANLNKH